MYNCYDQQVNFIQWCSLTFRFRREFEVRRERVEEGGGDERIVDWQRTKTGCARWGLRGKEGWWEEECPSWLSLPAAPVSFRFHFTVQFSVERYTSPGCGVVRSAYSPTAVWCSMALKCLKICVLCFSEMNVV